MIQVDFSETQHANLIAGLTSDQVSMPGNSMKKEHLMTPDEIKNQRMNLRYKKREDYVMWE